jgi:AraC-like DNA-binding protein/ligand-binding sensor protein
METPLIETLAGSKMYREYERAFSDTTGLTVSLRSVESWELPHHGKRLENPFCALLSKSSHACSACLQCQERLSQAATHEAKTVTCHLGLCETVVPVRMGDQLVGFLATGQVFRQKPTEAQYQRATRLFDDWGVETNRGDLHDAYFATNVMSQPKQKSATKLLAIFAEHLSAMSNQIAVAEQNDEPPFIARAKKFIEDHQTEALSLGMVAKAVGMSSFYFCKMFKKFTGLNFTGYVTRVRIERAKNLLLNQNLRISEIAFEVGFQSLTHFNRVFKQVMGRSPTDYRQQLVGA